MTSAANLHRTLQRLTKSLLVICVLMLAIAPVADSVMCGLEYGGNSSAELVADLDGGDDRDPPRPDHAICAHGHCHHAVPLVEWPEDDTADMRYARAENPLLLAVDLPSTNPPSLKRPPRV
jgi:hypothetical protein